METAPPPDPGQLPDPIPESPISVPPLIPVAAASPLPELPAYRGRGTLLVIFGVFQIILGLLAALMIPLMALGAFVSRLGPAGGMRPGQFFSGVASYVFIAAALLALGIGSVQMKRWARALTLVTSWYWLVMGALATVLLTAVLPVFMRGALAQMKQGGANSPSPEMSAGVMAVILTLIMSLWPFSWCWSQSHL